MMIGFMVEEVKMITIWAQSMKHFFGSVFWVVSHANGTALVHFLRKTPVDRFSSLSQKHPYFDQQYHQQNNIDNQIQSYHRVKHIRNTLERSMSGGKW